MRIETLVKETLDLQGFRVGRVDGGTDEIVVRIVADGRYAPRCGECGEKAKYRDERRERRYRRCQWPSKSAHFWPLKSAQLASVPAEGAKRPERGPMPGSGWPS